MQSASTFRPKSLTIPGLALADLARTRGHALCTEVEILRWRGPPPCVPWLFTLSMAAAELLDHVANFMDPLFLLLIPACILLLSGTLVGCWFVQRRQRYPLWIAASYALVGGALGLQSMMSAEEIHRWTVGTGAMYLYGSWCFARGMADYYGVSSHPRLALFIAGVVLVALYYYSRVDASLWARLHWLNAGLGLLQALPASAILRRKPLSGWLERTMYGLYVLFAINTSIRPLMSLALGSMEVKPQSFSTYWLLTLAITLVFSLLFTLLLLATAVREAMATLRAERNHDPLTNLLNRRAFQEAAERSLRNTQQGPWTLLMGDIDHFKRINDTWGHAQGDRVLQAVAHTMTQQVCAGELVARFGGEEFVLLLRTDTANAERVAQRIRSQLREDGALLKSGQSITISFGIAPVCDLAQLTLALALADDLLYKAKQAGRDRVQVAPSMRAPLAVP